MNTTIRNYPATISVEQAASILGISRSSGYRAVGRGEIPALWFGRRVVVPTGPFFAMLGIEETVDAVVQEAS